MTELNDLAKCRAVSEPESSHLLQAVLVEGLNAHAEPEVARGKLFAEDVNESRAAVKERGGDTLERHLGLRQIERSHQCAAEPAKRFRRAQVSRTTTEVNACDRPACETRLRPERLLDLSDYVLDHPCGLTRGERLVREGAESAARDRRVAKRVWQNADQETSAQVERR